MHHDDCNAWEYSTHPDVQSVDAYCSQFLIELRQDPASKQYLLADTRAAHAGMFGSVTPAACPYLAGNYRGSDFDCLRAYQVRFGNNLGTPAVFVLGAVSAFHQELSAAVADLDQAVAKAEQPLSPGMRTLRVVQVMAFALQRYFTIHPYANGNGHMGRVLVWVGLGRYNLLPKKWWLNRSPPGYGDLIQKHREGDPRPLERYLMRAIKGDL